ncbi:MAG: hypothetical protein ACRDRA_00975 [Pseudonocardiaceae bacterium]
MAARDSAKVGTVLVALVMGLGSIGMGWLMWPPAERGEVRAAQGTVVQSVLCGPPNAQDTVHVEFPDGHVMPARLDGCGHRLGEVLPVEVPDPLPAGEVVARLAGTGVSAATTDGRRFGALGVAVAGIGGALLAWRLRGGWMPRRRVGP